MPDCTRCHKVEVPPDELYCKSCKIPSKFDTLEKSRDTWAILGLFIPFCNFVACYYWSQFKNRSEWFTLLGFLGWIGYLILFCLTDKKIKEVKDE